MKKINILVITVLVLLLTGCSSSLKVSMDDGFGGNSYYNSKYVLLEFIPLTTIDWDCSSNCDSVALITDYEKIEVYDATSFDLLYEIPNHLENHNLIRVAGLEDSYLILQKEDYDGYVIVNLTETGYEVIDDIQFEDETSYWTHLSNGKLIFTGTLANQENLSSTGQSIKIYGLNTQTMIYEYEELNTNISYETKVKIIENHLFYVESSEYTTEEETSTGANTIEMVNYKLIKRPLDEIETEVVVYEIDLQKENNAYNDFVSFDYNQNYFVYRAYDSISYHIVNLKHDTSPYSIDVQPNVLYHNAGFSSHFSLVDDELYIEPARTPKGRTIMLYNLDLIALFKEEEFMSMLKSKSKDDEGRNIYNYVIIQNEYMIYHHKYEVKKIEVYIE
jgi:hypothetical protein